MTEEILEYTIIGVSAFIGGIGIGAGIGGLYYILKEFIKNRW